MIKVFILFIVLIAGIILGPLLAGHQGYVFIRTDNYDITTSITSLVLSFILLQFVLLFLGWCYRRFISTTSRTKGWVSGRKYHKAHSQTQKALLKLAEGDFDQVEKLMSKHADFSQQPVINYLLAAEAAQQRGDEYRTHQYLNRAAEVAGSDQLPVDISRVRIQLAEDEVYAARTGIDKLLDQAPRHPEILRLAEQAYLRSGAYQALIELLPVMAKVQLHSEDELEALKLKAYKGLMNQCMAENGSEGLKDWWKAQPRKIRHEIALQSFLAEHLIECNDMESAEKIIIDGLKQQYDERLLLLAPRLRSDKPEQLEKVLKQLVKQSGATPLLNSTMGQIALQHAQWEHAESYFKAALAQRFDAHDAAWLADALDKLHKAEEAAKIRQEALLHSLKKDRS
ncbi:MULTISPECIES: protoheme IX biogenesis protein HemY [Providencia]|uniref:protoheme IX biogenesis protein HemY n=1 Tax=Providencia TaxID=586 RepID=UPI000EF8AB4D|nr:MULTISPECIES: protoheme IX biogenesis protein HemY [Providencia]EMF0918055.1 protoheme IX biogenesis protein HemY [Providencia stuartii]MCR4079830.1 protoheme IX biogenesis protein HemY [Providencia stuartii]RMA15577.1 protoheme IX biogenesis protein HemY [Providencia stuartii]